jgi:hypothetical protein
MWEKRCHRGCHVTIADDMKACGQNDVTIADDLTPKMVGLRACGPEKFAGSLDDTGTNGIKRCE